MRRLGLSIGSCNTSSDGSGKLILVPHGPCPGWTGNLTMLSVLLNYLLKLDLCWFVSMVSFSAPRDQCYFEVNSDVNHSSWFVGTICGQLGKGV